MFSKKKISLFIIVLGLLIATITGLRSHGLYHDAKKPYLEFTGIRA